jgi:transposase
VQLSQRPGLEVKSVAAALEIHPFMLSKWRKDVRDGRLSGHASKAPKLGPAREIAKLQELEKAHALLKEEHELLKKAIRFCSARKAMRSPSSTRNARSSA